MRRIEVSVFLKGDDSTLAKLTGFVEQTQRRPYRRRDSDRRRSRPDEPAGVRLHADRAPGGSRDLRDFRRPRVAGLGRLLDNRERLTEEQRVWQELSLTFLRISDDVAHARSRAVRDVSGFELRGSWTAFRSARARRAEPRVDARRRVNYGGGPRSDLRRVAYRLKEGRLVRITWPVLDRAP